MVIEQFKLYEIVKKLCQNMNKNRKIYRAKMIKIFTVIKMKVRLKRKLKRYGADYKVVHQRKS